MIRLHSLLSLLALLLLPSCASAPPEQWAPGSIPMCSPERLWEVTRLALEHNGFSLLEQGYDPRTRSLSSAWDKDLHPFKGHGFRERAHVRYEVGEEPDTLLLSVRVEREVNENLAKPLDPEYAQWAEAPDNPERARFVLQYVRSLLGTQLELGKKAPREKAKEKEHGRWE